MASYAFGREWKVFNYWEPSSAFNILSLPRSEWSFYGTLLAVCVPFIAVGLLLTLRRLRDAGLPLYVSLLFFIPVLNLIMFLLLSVAPQADTQPTSRSRLASYIPSTKTGAAAAGVFAAVLIAIPVVMSGTYFLMNYGWGLFVGIPFAIGMVSSMLFNFHESHSYNETLGVSMTAIILTGSVLFGIAFEGAICLLMAAPLAIPLAMAGAAIGRFAMLAAVGSRQAATIIPMLILVLPGITQWEGATSTVPQSLQVQTVVEIDAPPETVWRNVVTFSELPPAQEWYFKMGIAYPQRATITGTGVGAVRHCEFSTGAFVEPITHWEAPRRLAFGVTSQPPAMHELSFAKIEPPHIADRYLKSEQGEFRLEPLPGGGTRLTGTTWYTLRFWPNDYWRLWSDAIIHRIHLRVLNHIKTLSEHR
ncbi:MAG TPA: SRPBCC family protein [Terriglobales bacterium]|nr:SRPBCC family protein [Terriglobales bacterium]